MSMNYRAKIAIRSKNKLCVRVPPKILKNADYKVGDVVDVSIQRVESESSDHANDQSGGAL